MIKVSDYIANKLAESDIKDVFMVTGGGAMHLNNSLGKHPSLNVTFNHHEQACAIAAESYARLTNRIAAVCVTTGPGGTNTITGVYGAWVDSIPMLVISGQVKYETTVDSTGLELRQLGDQECNIVKMVSTVTKYAVMVTKPEEIRYHLEKALYLAKQGRPGPCWLDIPINVQGALIDEESLRPYDPAEEANNEPLITADKITEEIIDRLKKAQRPVVFAGSGIRLAGAHADFLRLVNLLNIPVVTAWNAHDVIYNAHPLYFGRPGTIGDRAGNFITQNADLLLVLGCRLNIRQISYDWKSFARAAFKIIIDIDPLELKKPTVKADMPVNADVADVIKQIIKKLANQPLEPKNDWLEWCRIRKEKYPVVLKEYWDRSDLVNPYCFIDELFKQLPENQVIVTGNGSACVCGFQAAYIKPGQRLYTNSGCAAMGYDLPAALGACIGSNKSPVICITGDGSIQMNIQELQTIVHYNLPVKIFVLNNFGYQSIRQTQRNFFGGKLVGCDEQSGVSFPNLEKLTGAYGISFARCYNHSELESCISTVLKENKAYICEIMITPEQNFAPKTSSVKLADGRIVSRPLEDLSPFLNREEFKSNMIIEPIS